jgi:hypothetical protein
MSNTNYALICFGVLGNNCDGSRTFSPVAYGWGEGEREIVALHSFLSIKFAMSELYGVNDIHFKGGTHECSESGIPRKQQNARLHSHCSEIYFTLEQKGKWRLHHTLSNKELKVGVQRGKARHQPITSLQNQTTVRVLCRLDGASVGIQR